MHVNVHAQCVTRSLMLHKTYPIVTIFKFFMMECSCLAPCVSQFSLHDRKPQKEQCLQVTFMITSMSNYDHTVTNLLGSKTTLLTYNFSLSKKR